MIIQPTRPSTPGSWRAAVTVLLLVYLPVTACGRQVPAGPVRLLEHRERTEIEWPAEAEAPPDGLRHAAIGRLGRTSAFEVDAFTTPDVRDSRAVLLAPSPSRYRFRLRVPAGAALRCATTVLPGPEAPSRRVTFSVAVSDPGEEPTEVLRETIAASETPTWREHTVDLARWSDREITLDLETASDDGSLAWGAWGVPEIVGPLTSAPGRDVILISLDTLRADRLSGYGYDRPTSPHLDQLAAAGVRFATAVAQSPWTRPSHRSMLTGLYPIARAGFDRRPLALVLWRNGYRTTALTGGGQVDARFGFQTGFEVYRVEDWLASPERVADRLEAGRGRDDFLFLHTFATHDPYTDTRFAENLPPGRIRGQFSVRDREGWARAGLTDEEKTYVEALYDGGVAAADERLGTLFETLDRRGLLADAIVIVTSDHGEAFWEHGIWRHGTTLYDHQLLVPLLLRLPDRLLRRLDVEPGTVVDRQVELIDVYPTLLDLLDIESEREVQGRSLVPLLAGEPVPPRRAYAENTNHATYERKAFRTGRYKFVYSMPRDADSGAAPYVELYDLERDPGERVNLAETSPDVVRREMERLEVMLAGARGALEEELPEGLDADLEERLRALGYVGN